LTNKSLVFGSNHTLTQRDQIFNMVNFMRTLGLSVNLNLLIVHHHLTIIWMGENINLDLFYDKNMLVRMNNAKKTMNPKAWGIFMHILMNVIFKYMLQVKDTKKKINNNACVLNNIKAYYGCYETTSWHSRLNIHTLLLFNNWLDPSLIHALQDNENFQDKMINYLNNVIVLETPTLISHVIQLHMIIMLNMMTTYNHSPQTPFIYIYMPFANYLKMMCVS